MITGVYQNIINLRNREQKVKSFFISFYIIGLAGLVIPFTNPVFLKLTPYALILSFMAVVLFHRNIADRTALIVFVSIFLTGFIIELIGVNTGVIFGEYRYGKGLGPKLWQTPILIGINWLLLVYITSGIISRLNMGMITSALAASALMLLYDILLEHVAPQLDMWYWQNGSVPLKNYVAWYLLAFLFHMVVKVFKTETDNKLSFIILACHMLFFTGLIIFQIIL